MSADYDVYKYYGIPQDTTIFLYKSDYFKTLVELNVKDYKKLTAQTLSKMEQSSIKNILTRLPENQKQDIFTLHQILQSVFLQLKNTPQSDIQRLNENKKLADEIQNILEDLYKKVLYPSKDNQNNAGIYRVGTFMAYFIQSNRSRFFEDSLITQFQSMFYDENSDITIDRIKKL